jgi:hypothetical protein
VSPPGLMGTTSTGITGDQGTRLGATSGGRCAAVGAVSAFA